MKDLPPYRKKSRGSSKHDTAQGPSSSGNTRQHSESAQTHPRQILALGRDFVDELSTGAGHPPPTTIRHPRSAPFEPDGILEARRRQAAQYHTQLRRLMLYSITFSATLAPILVRMVAITQTRRHAEDNAYRAAVLVNELKKQFPPGSPFNAFALSTASNISTALAFDAVHAMRAPSIATQLCWLSGICTGLMTAVSAATLPWMYRHGGAQSYLEKSVRMVRGGLYATIGLYFVGFLDLLRLLASGAPADPLLLVACTTTLLALYVIKMNRVWNIWMPQEQKLRLE